MSEWAGLVREILTRFRGPLLPGLLIVFFGLMWWSAPKNPWFMAATGTSGVWFVVELIEKGRVWIKCQREKHQQRKWREESAQQDEEARVKRARNWLLGMPPMLRAQLIQIYEEQAGDPGVTIPSSHPLAGDRGLGGHATFDCRIDDGEKFRYILSQHTCKAIDELLESRDNVENGS